VELTVARALAVEVVYASPGRPVLVGLEVPPGTTLGDAIERSGILRQCPDIDLRRQAVGVFGRLRRLEEAVQPGDRIEIYRPLPAAPVEMRRRRAAR
jgi:uncharacterized protein